MEVVRKQKYIFDGQLLFLFKVIFIEVLTWQAIKKDAFLHMYNKIPSTRLVKFVECTNFSQQCFVSSSNNVQ
jgi:hypothetical protein